MRLPTIALLMTSLLLTAPAVADEKDKEIEQLKAMVRDLQQRVRKLEAQALAQPQPSQAPPPQAQAQPRPTEAPALRTATGTSAPSATSAEAEETSRALERTLVTQGALLLPAWARELTPSFQYTFNRDANRVRTETELLGLGFRLGLPSQLQLDLALPSLVNTRTSGSNIAANHQGISDLSVGLSRQFLSEGDWVPSIIGGVAWKSATGTSGITRTLGGSDTDAVSISAMAVKRKDPLVFVGQYSHIFQLGSANGVSPGDIDSLSLGGILAASPDVAVRSGVTMNYGHPFRIGTVTGSNSDIVTGVASLGASVSLTNSLLLDGEFDFGLTPDTPNLSFVLSLPVRF